MAYKSQVTNKYMGSTFKGAPRSNRNPQATELGQIVSVLKNDLTPAVANWAEANIEGQQDAAKKKIESMYASGKSMADINKEILDGGDQSIQQHSDEIALNAKKIKDLDYILILLKQQESARKALSEVGNEDTGGGGGTAPPEEDTEAWDKFLAKQKAIEDNKNKLASS